MADVFVSYKAEDRRRVKPLVEALKADGYSVWWDAQIGGGAAWRHAIEDELNAAHCVIVVWSKRSVGRDGVFVQDEATRAQQRHVYVPVMIDKVHVPLGFGETQALPLTGWRGNRSDPQYQAVLAAVEHITGDQDRAPAAHMIHRTRVSRRALLGGSAVAIAAVTAGGAWILLKPCAAGSSNSIAVLPFANLSGDPSQAYFSDGMAEELRNALAQTGQLKVVGRTSSEIVRNEDAKTAARRLGVANVLTGSVRLSENLIRVATQLIDGETGLQHWSATYDRRPGDALLIQGDIARKVADALNVRLGRGQQATLTKGGTQNPVAQDRYLRAVAIYQSAENASDYRQSVRLLDAAIDQDPNYANAYAQKAMALAILTGAFSSEFIRGYSQAASVARKAIQLAPDSAIGRVALAMVLTGQIDLRGAFEQYEKAAATGSGSADFLIEYSQFLSQLGSVDEALAIARRAMTIDPLNPRAATMEATALFAARRYRDAVQAANHVLELSPDQPTMRIMLGDAFSLLGRYDEARAQYSQVPADDLFRRTSEAILAARVGDRAASGRILEGLRKEFGDAANWQYAQVHAQRGEGDQALAALHKGFTVRDPGITWVQIDPWLDPIRKDPRFKAFVRKLNLPSAA